MKQFKVVFIKNGLRYETHWKAESEVQCVFDIEDMFTVAPDYKSACPQNVVMSVEEEQ